MIDIKYITSNPDAVKKNCEKRGTDPKLIDQILVLDEKRKKLIAEVETMRAEVNKLSKIKGKPTDEQREAVRNIKTDLKVREEESLSVKSDLQEKMDWLPNLTDDEVPVGDESQNKVLKTVGEPRKFEFEPQPHHVIGLKLGVIDIERAVKISGSGFYFLRNELVLVRNAIVQILFNRLREQGFSLAITPVASRRRTLYGTGYFPFAVKDNYNLENTDLILTGTSEQVLVAQHSDEILEEATLPLLYAADSQCFRTESGSYGKDTQGIIRVHQFGKVEQIVICKPEESEHWHQKCLENEEWLLKELEIPYQTVLISTGDMGSPGYKKYDLEGWMPSQDKYRELTSNTNLTDFQTRRLNIRYRNENGDTCHPHTISATGFSDRLLLSLLENMQNEDGSVDIPKILQSYLGGLEKISPK